MANPWYGIEGLGQGLLQGYMVGADVRERRRREKQEQMREALMMLYPAIKSDPQAVKQMEPYLKQLLGPQFQMPAIKPPEQQEQEAITQRLNFIKQKMPWLSDREAGVMAMGYAPPKPEGQTVQVSTPWGSANVKPEAALRYQQYMQGQQPKQVYMMGPEGPQLMGEVPHGAAVRFPPQARGEKGPKGQKAPKTVDYDKAALGLLKLDPTFGLLSVPEQIQKINETKRLLQQNQGGEEESKNKITPEQATEELKRRGVIP